MDHLLAKPKLTSPAANKEFLSQYLKVHVQNGLTSPKKAIEIIVSELGCKISQTTASEALGIAISKLTYDVNKGYNHLTEYVRITTLDFLLSMETYICENIFKKHLFALTLQDKSLLPRIQAKLNTEIEQSVYYRIQRTGYNTAVVTGTTIVRKYSVDTENYFCSCGQYQEKGYPCTHAAAFLISVGKNPQEFCHKICYGEYQKRMFNISGNYRPTVLADLIGVQTTSNTYKLI